MQHFGEALCSTGKRTISTYYKTSSLMKCVICTLQGTLVESSTCSALIGGHAGWKLRDDICGGSKNEEGNCFGVRNYADAVTQCESLGARLCTSDEASGHPGVCVFEHG